MGTTRLKVPAKAGEEVEIYAVELNGLHAGLKMKFTYAAKRKWNYETRSYDKAGIKTKTEIIHKIVHNNGKSVSISNLSEKEHRNYWESKFQPTTYNLSLDTKVTLFIPHDTKEK